MSTITIEKGNTVYGGDSEDYNTYIVKDGGKLDIQRRLWKADGGVTVEPGGSFVKDGSFETYTHIKSKVVIGEEGNETVSTLSLTSSSYPWSISTLWNGSLTAYNTNIKLGDLGSVGATKLYDCVVNLDGIIAMGVNTANGSHTFTNTTVSVKGYAIRKDSTYFSAEGSILNKLTLDNSTITIDDGAAGSTSQKTVIKKLTMKNNSVITVESGANTILAGEISIDGTSSLSVGNLQIDEGAKLVIDGENTESVIRFSGTFSNTGANGLTVDMTNVKNSMYKVLDYTGDAASAPTDYGTIKFVNLSDGFRGVSTVENGDLCVTAISNDTEVAAPVEDKVVEVSATEKKSIKSHVVNVGSNKTALHRVEAPSEDVTTGTKTEGNVTTTFINPAGNIYLNSQAEDITDKTEFRTSVEQESKEYNIFVNNYTSAEDEEQNGGYATTGGVMSITGSLNSAKDIVINNGEGAVMQGADEDTGFKASAVNMEITNDGHMVADVHADKNMTIHNNSMNTLKGTVSGKTVVIDGTGKIENAVIDSYDTLTIEDTQTLVNSTLTAKTFVNDGMINMDSSSLIQWGKTWTDNTGTINVSVGDAPEERVYKVIDYTGASTTKKYTTTNYTVDNTDYSFTTVDSDLYVENLDGIDYSTIAVGYNWTDYDYGKDIEIGETIYYYKINAFGTLSDVKKTLLTDGVTILFADAEEVPGTSTAIDALTVGNFELTIDGVAKRQNNGVVKLTVSNPKFNAVLNVKGGCDLSLKEISTTETYAGTKTINIGSTDEDKVKLNVDKLATQGSSVELNIVNADLTVTTFDVYGDGSYIGKDAEVKAGKITVYSGSSLSISDGAAVTADTIDNRMGSTVDLSAGVTLTVNGNFENAGTISLAGESSIDIEGSLTGNGTISMVDGILSGSLTDSGTNKIEILGQENEISGDIKLGGEVRIGQENSSSELLITGALKSLNEGGFIVGYSDSVYDTVLTVSGYNEDLKAYAVAGSESHGFTINQGSTVNLEDGGSLAFKSDFTNKGTITVTMDGADESDYLLIHNLGDTSAELGNIDTSSLEDSGYVTFLSNADSDAVLNDLFAVKVDYSKLFVNSDWAGSAEGQMVKIGEDKYFFGYNAFATEADAFAKAQEKMGDVEDSEITLNIQKIENSESGTTVKLLTAGTYILTNGSLTDANSVAIKSQAKDANISVKDFTGKIIKITGGKDANDVYVANTMDIKDSVIGDANYTDGTGWWTFYGTKVTIDNSIVGADFGKDYFENVSEMPRSRSALEESAEYDIVPFAENYQKTRIGTVNEMTITDSTLNTAFFCVSGTGKADADNSVIYYGSSFTVGADSPNGSYVWSAAADPSYRPDKDAQINLKDSIAVYRGFGNGNAGYGVLIGSDTNGSGTLSLENSELRADSTTAGAVGCRDITIYAKGSLVLDESKATARQLTNGGTITIDALSTIEAETFSGASGTITVDMSEGEETLYKLIDVDNDSSFGTYSLASGKENGYTLTVVDKDLYASNVDMSVLLVNASWATGKAIGDKVAEGFYYGFNAFDKFFDAVGEAASNTTVSTIKVLSNITETIADDYEIGQNLTITTDTELGGLEHVVIDANKDSGTWAIESAKSAGGSVTIDSSVEIQHIRQWIAGYYESDGAEHTLNLNGKMVMSQLALWSANEKASSTVNISSTANIHMGMGDGVIDFRDNGKINVTGTLADTTDATLNALTDADKQLYGGYIQVRPGSSGVKNEFNLKKTYVGRVAWISENTDNGKDGEFTLNMDTSALEVGYITLSDRKSTLNVKTGSRLILTSTEKTSSFGSKVVLDVNGSEFTAKTVSNSGTINVTDSEYTADTTNSGTFNVSGNSTLSGTFTGSGLKVGSGTITLKDFSFDTSGDGLLLGDNAEVTLTGSGYSNIIRHVTAKHSEGADSAKGYNLTFDADADIQTYALYTGWGSKVTFKEGSEYKTLYLNLSGGTVSVEKGATVEQSQGLMNAQANITGTLNVAGTLVMDGVNVYGPMDGYSNSGSIDVTGTMTSESVKIGVEVADKKKYYNDGTKSSAPVVSVHGDGASLKLESSYDGIQIGGAAAGTLKVYDGGIVEAGNPSLASASYAVSVQSNGTIQLENSGKITAESLSNEGTITIDALSIIEAKTFSGANGTITVDMSEGTETFYKLIDVDNDSTFGTYDFASGKDNGYTFFVKDKDLYASNVDMSKLLVNGDWATGKAIGDKVAEGFYYGFNAFSNLTDAFAGRSSDTVTISLAGGSETPALTADAKWKLSKDTEIIVDGETPVTAKVVTASGCDVLFTTDSGTEKKKLTIGKDVTLEVKGDTRTLYFGYLSTSSDAIKAVVNGNLDVDQLYSSYGTETEISGQVKIKNALLMHGSKNAGKDGSLDQGESFVKFIGTNGSYSKDNEQLHASAVQLFGGTLEFKDTYATVDGLIHLYNYNDAADGTRALTLSGSTLNAGSLQVEDNGAVTIDGSSSLNVGSITSTGTFELVKGGSISVSSGINASITLSGLTGTYEFVKAASYTGTGTYEFTDLSFSNTEYALVVNSNAAWATNADKTVIKVDGSWSSKSYGDVIDADKGFFYGYNAFSNLTDAFAGRSSDTVTISLAGGSETPTLTADAEWKLSKDTEIIVDGETPVTAKVVTASGCDVLFMTDSGTEKKKLTIGKDVTLEVKGDTRTLYFGYLSTSSDAIKAVVNGNLDVEQLYSSYGTETEISGQVKVKNALLMHGSKNAGKDGSLDQGESFVKFIGTDGSYSKDNEQLHAGAVQLFGGTLEFTDTYATVDGLIHLYNYNDDANGKRALTLSKSTLNAGSLQVEDNGAVTIDASSSLNVGSISSSGSITIDALSAIDAETFSGTSGTITVDMSAGTDSVYKLIDVDNDSDFGTYDFATGKDNGYTLSVKDKDLFASNVDMSKLLVNGDWATDKAAGDKVADGFYYGFNAFSNLTDAFAGRSSDTVTISLAGGSETPALTADAEWKLSKDTEIIVDGETPVTAKVVTASGCDVLFMTDSGTEKKKLTIGKDVTLEVKGDTRTLYFGYLSTSNDAIKAVVNGNLDVDQLYSSYGTETEISGQVKIKNALLMHGSKNAGNAKSLDQGESFVKFVGTDGSYSKDNEQLHASAVQLFGGTLEFKDTYATVDGLIHLYNYNDDANGTRALTLSGSTLNAGSLQVEDNGTVTIDGSSSLNVGSISSSGSITLSEGGVIAFSGTITVTNKIALDGFTSSVDTPVLVADYTGTETYTIDSYAALIDISDTSKFRVVNNDLYYFGDEESEIKLYVNTGYGAGKENDGHTWGVDAFADFASAQAIAGDTSAVIYGVSGTFNSTSAMNGYETVLEDGTYQNVIGSQKTAASKAREWVEDITEGSDLTINGGTFNSNVFGGTYINKGSVYQEGDLNLEINGGTFERNVFAGMCFNSKSLMDMCYLKGDVNFTIAGGTFKSYVYGGSSSWGSDLYSRGNTIEGDINILLDASSNDHQIVFAENSALLAGCEMYGVVDGDTKVTLTGSGENLTFNGRSLSGGCGSDGHSAGNVVTWVTGERILAMDEFNGNFDGRLVMFSEFNMNGSTVNLTYEKGSMLYDVDTWNMDESSLSGFMGNNDFTGDTLNLTYSDDAVVFDADKAAGIANWDKFEKVTINSEVAEYVDGSYCTDEFKFGLDASDNTKLIITKINA